jgi:putative ABC transport system permease protein
MKKNVSPPKFILRFFRWYCHPKLHDFIEGDLLELYKRRVNETDRRKADIKFIVDVLLLFRPGIIRPAEGHRNLNTYGMYKSYFKIGWRTLLKNKGYSLINIGGLALGMTVAILIGLWIFDELSFNKYHQNYSTIAKVYRNHLFREGGVISNPVHPTGLATLLKTEYANHFQKVVLIRSRIEERVLAIDDKKFTQQGYFMQPEGSELFSLNMKRGTRDGLKDMQSIFLSESLAKKIFGDNDPINQVLSMDAKWDLKVTGVYEDLPKNSEFSQASYFAPLDLFLNGWSDLNVWNNYNMHIYVQLHEGDSPEQVSVAIKDAMLPHVDDDAKKTTPELFVWPMNKWHLFSQFKDGVQVTSERMKFVWFYTLTGIFVLLLACINFMNLSTARSEKRAREVGIRKSIGSYRSQLVYQFFTESILVAMLSFIISLVLVYLLIPSFNNVADKNITVPWTNPFFWAAGISFSLITGILAGSYPALYLSSFNPVKVLKGTFKAGRSASTPRRVLVVVQFTVSISLIVATIIVYQQIQFAKNRPVGYSREGLISLHSKSPEFKGKFEVLRNEFKKTGMVEEMAESDYSVTSTLGWNGGFEWKGKKPDMVDATFNINRVTFEYGKTIGWDFTDGRDFSREFPSDVSGVVINESARKMMGLENPTGEILTLNRDNNNRKFTILGVIKDVVKGSPYEPTDPCLYFLTERDEEWIYIRMKPNVSPHEALPVIEKAFTGVITSAPFDYKFADEEYTAKFRSEERVGILATFFSSLTILISCAGLFGLSSFVAEQRTKEIGIRKVLGASVTHVWRLLSSEFVVLILISCAVSIPLSYYCMSGWLEQYQYRTILSWHVFAVAGMGALVITLLTISVQAIKAALANPVKSLRSE